MSTKKCPRHRWWSAHDWTEESTLSEGANYVWYTEWSDNSRSGVYVSLVWARAYADSLRYFPIIYDVHTSSSGDGYCFLARIHCLPHQRAWQAHHRTLNFVRRTFELKPHQQRNRETGRRSPIFKFLFQIGDPLSLRTRKWLPKKSDIRWWEVVAKRPKAVQVIPVDVLIVQISLCPVPRWLWSNQSEDSYHRYHHHPLQAK